MNSPIKISKPEPSFRAHLLHKLNVIARAEGTRQEAARLLGTDNATMTRWLSGESWPQPPKAALIDRRYLMAWEKLRIYGSQQQRQWRAGDESKVPALTSALFGILSHG